MRFAAVALSLVALAAFARGQPNFAGEWIATATIGDAEAAEVASNFRRENARARRLRAGVQMGVRYRLVSRKEILADDARLAAKHPVSGNAPRPGSMRYIAISAVGFNAARTKALVYARFRTLHDSHEFRMKGIGPRMLRNGTSYERGAATSPARTSASSST